MIGLLVRIIVGRREAALSPVVEATVAAIKEDADEITKTLREKGEQRVRRLNGAHCSALDDLRGDMARVRQR